MGYCVPFRNGGVRKWDEHIWPRYGFAQVAETAISAGGDSRKPVGTRLTGLGVAKQASCSEIPNDLFQSRWHCICSDRGGDRRHDSGVKRGRRNLAVGPRRGRSSIPFYRPHQANLTS
jgi:hypothetical protein